ncbi:membrane-associating domain-containing protein [Phyllosticta citricarpa]|uniref:Membrane-associating domain-containing protein n=2 Tax=Phyllosticta TaxID=121621 RepID=A0ABR1MD53_9PEZI
MAFNWLLPLRIAQAVFTIIVLGLVSFVSNWWTNHWFADSPAEVNFLIFTSVWTLLALGYLLLAPWKFPAAAHKYAVLAVEALTMLFWFAGFIAIAVWLDNRVCFGTVCDSARAATAFAAFEWAIFFGTVTLAALHVWRTRSTAEKGPAPEMQTQNA